MSNQVRRERLTRPAFHSHSYFLAARYSFRVISACPLLFFFFFPPLYDLSSIFRLGNSSTDRIAIIVISEGSLTALNIFLFFFFCSTEIRDYVEHSVHKIIFEIALKLFAAVLGSQFFCTAIRDSLRDLRLTSVAVSTRFRVTCRQLSENSAR